MSEKNTEAKAQVQLVTIGEGDTAVQIDRLALDKSVQRAFKSEEGNLAYLLQLMDDSFWSEIWLDERVTNAEGKQFKTWGLWYADRVKDYPIAEGAITKPFIRKMLENASVREVMAASGKSRGYVHELNLERQGKQTTKEKNAVKKAAAEKAKAEGASTPAEVTSEQGGTSDLSVLVDEAVSAISKVINQIANLTAEDLARFSAKVAEGHTAADAMTGINQVNEAVNEKAAPKPANPRGNGKAEAVSA
jgi:hypothetical protein